MSKEEERLRESHRREGNWKRWGPYLAERQWATVREDYSANGDSWGSFPHAHARSRVYRWGEDGLLGLCDRQCRLALAPALWNGRDPFLKERLFGLTGPQGNHGEDVKECYYYLDATPTHSYGKALYKYPQAEFPYAWLVEENGNRGREQPEFELTDTGIFDEERYFDVFVEYAKAGPNDLLVAYEVYNRGPEAAEVWVLPTLWFRNTWSWGRQGEDYGPEPRLWWDNGVVECDHHQLGRFTLAFESPPDQALFTHNETNRERLYGASNPQPYVKDAFHRYLVERQQRAVNPAQAGTKMAAVYHLSLESGQSRRICLRLSSQDERPTKPFGQAYHRVFAQSRKEADEFYAARDPGLSDEDRLIWRQAYAGLLWSKQFYFYSVEHWLEGDPSQPPPPRQRWTGRNESWRETLYNRDVILMPDSWEYPWYAAWDLAFHVFPLARLDPDFAKQQLVLMLREWYMHPSGAIPAYEFNFSDVNPPVHAWAVLRVYRTTGSRDRAFLERCFHKLLLNFTWWVNRTDQDGNNVFSGGFLGLDNIGVFDRSRFPRHLGELEQADATAWMAFFSLRMLAIALELARQNPVYEDIASKFFEHFVAITDSVNHLGELGLWDPQDGFYYDVIRSPQGSIPLKVRSMVGLLPLIAVEILDGSQLAELEGFRKRMEWLLDNRPGLARHIVRCPETGNILLAVAPQEQLVRVLDKMLDTEEFLSKFGIRSLSRFHARHPYRFITSGQEYRVDYEPAESVSGMFGGNSNWRGPVWFPVNYLLIDALKRHYQFYRDQLKVAFPSRSRHRLTLLEVAHNLENRLASLFRRGPHGRPAHAGEKIYSRPEWQDLVLFYEYFDAETGKGLGASHQTGWTALVARSLEDIDPDHCLRG
ncbi:MAG: glucosidase [Vulcanimicrobiota bacterium]